MTFCVDNNPHEFSAMVVEEEEKVEEGATRSDDTDVGEVRDLLLPAAANNPTEGKNRPWNQILLSSLSSDSPSLGCGSCMKNYSKMI